MRNFQGIVFIWTRTYSEIFKSGLVYLLDDNIKIVAARKYHEGKWICRLKSLAPHGLNTEIGDYVKEMYNFC